MPEPPKSALNTDARFIPRRAEKNYIRRPLDLLRVHHEKIEAWILEQAGIVFDAKVAPGALRVA